MTIQLPRKGILFCLVGPAGSGKTTLGNKLMESFGGTIRPSVSVTTRAPRTGEAEGSSYFFVSREEFQRRVDRGEFFEWEETHGNLYGSLKSTVEGAVSSGMDLLLDIDIRGAMNFKEAYPNNTVICFLLPPSPLTLISRMQGRGSMEGDELKRRLETARVEYEMLLDDGGKKVDYLIVNDKLEESFRVLQSVITTERSSLKRMIPARLSMYCTVEI